MNYQTQYEVNEDLILLSAKQTFFKVFLKKKWIFILALFLFGLMILLNTEQREPQIFGSVFITIGAFLAILWVKSYFATLSHHKSAFRVSNEGMLTMDINDEIIQIELDGNSRSVKLSAITAVIETDDFLVLMSSKTPVFIALKKALNDEVREWLLKMAWR